MPRYTVKVGDMHVVSERPISPELRKELIKAVASALADMDGELGAGCTLVFDFAS